MRSNIRGSGTAADPGPALDLDATRIDLNKLRTFAVIAQAGGVSAAATRLALSRSAVSHSLAGIESELGIPLFHRVGKRMVLTREGKLLQAAYREAEGSIAVALSSIGEASQEARGELRIGLYPGFSRFRLAGLLEAILSEHPRARCRLFQGPRRELLADLLAARLDFVLSLGPAERESRGRTLARPVFQQSLVLACHKDLQRSGSGFEAVSRLPIIDYFRSEPLFERWVSHHFRRRKLGGASLRAQVRAWVGSGTDVALELTRRGVGACVLPQDLVDPFRKQGELSILRGTGKVLRDEIWLHQLDDARPSALHEAFRQALL